MRVHGGGDASTGAANIWTKLNRFRYPGSGNRIFTLDDVDGTILVDVIRVAEGGGFFASFRLQNTLNFNEANIDMKDAGLVIGNVLGGAGRFVLRIDDFSTDPDNLLEFRAGGTIVSRVDGSGTVVNKTKAGAPVDGDMDVAGNGALVVDTTNDRIYVRSAGTWKSVAVA